MSASASATGSDSDRSLGAGRRLDIGTPGPAPARQCQWRRRRPARHRRWHGASDSSQLKLAEEPDARCGRGPLEATSDGTARPSEHARPNAREIGAWPSERKARTGPRASVCASATSGASGCGASQVRIVDISRRAQAQRKFANVEHPRARSAPNSYPGPRLISVR